MILRFVLLLLLLMVRAYAQAPAPAAAVGYNTLTYGPQVTVGTDPTTVPLSQGSTWQKFAFFGNSWQNLNPVITQNADGSVTLGTNTPAGFGNMLSTAAPINNVSQTYIQGTAFGGGFYAEVTMSFALNVTTGGPAFWANDIESMAAGSEGDVSLRHWAGQVRNYGDWIENDITEFDSQAGGGCTSTSNPCLHFSLHNFYGPGGEFGGETFQVNDQTANAGNLYTQTVSPTCVTSNNPNTPPTGTGTGIVDGTCRWNFVSSFSGEISTNGSGSPAQQPNGNDFTQKHKYAALWVPATATTQGFVKYYFDGVQIGNTCTWNQYNSATAPPPVDSSNPCGGSSAYSVMDSRHMALILGNATSLSGQNPGPVTVYAVNVWQKDASQDIGPTNSQSLASGGALPSGYFNVSGNQIQDGSGNNLRIAATTYRGASTNLAMMQAIRTAGFNAVKLDWRDAGLISQTASGSCGTQSELDACISIAQQANLKVVLSHRGNEIPKTTTSACNARQANGLWFDSGGSSGNDDGCGDGGNFTYAQFKTDTVNLLQRYVNNSTIIGYEFHHEPLVNGSFTGQGGGGGGGTGQFVAKNGQITDPNGTPWVGRGFNVNIEDVSAGNVPLATLQRLFPRVNYVRVSNFLGGGYTDSITPQSVSAWVASLTNVGIRVEFSDYAGNSPACRTGGDLTNASNWYKGVAQFYASNPFVGYESQNECFDNSNGPFTWASQVTANYNAVRSAAPNAMFVIGSPGGTATPSGQYLNSQLSLSTMTNVVWDIHPYVGSSCCGYIGQGVPATQAAYDTALAGWINSWKTWTTTSEGAIPVISGEFGNSTDGKSIDATGQLAVQSGADNLSTTNGSSGVGYWEWFCGCNGPGIDQITTGGSNPSIDTTAPYGASVQTFIANAPGTGPTPLGSGGGGVANAAVNWGGGGDTDIRLACSDVGTAVFAVNPGVIEFCPAPLNNSTVLLNGGAKP